MLHPAERLLWHRLKCLSHPHTLLYIPRWTPLILAALCGSVELLELLLDRGAEINAADGSKWSTAQRREPSTLYYPSRLSYVCLMLTGCV